MIANGYPHFPPNAELVVDMHNGPEEWTGQQWNDYVDAASRSGSMVTARLVSSTALPLPPGGAARPMTLDQAERNIGRPVIAHDPPRNAHGLIEVVNHSSGMVGVRVNRHRFPYDPLKTLPWWHPARLTLKEGQ